MDVKIEQSWKEAFADEFAKPYFAELTAFVKQEYVSKTIYPKPADLFKAFNTTPFNAVRVVIIGQDPYHGAGQAMGLSFAVQHGVSIPPSLRNIFIEIKDDIGATTLPVGSGDLTPWAEQGVLLLNATLTVQATKAGSHQGKGWEQFTDAAIAALSARREHLVFILWGNFAKQKKTLIDTEKHHIIESAHPSPFSASNGFFGSKPFSKTNEYLESQGYPPVKW